MNTLIKTGAVALTAISLAACTTTGQVERNAAGGAALGAAIGAGIGAISGDVGVGEGAAAGAVVGGVVGASRGNQIDREQNGGTTAAPILDKANPMRDANGRIYYHERGTSRTFYANGERRT